MLGSTLEGYAESDEVGGEIPSANAPDITSPPLEAAPASAIFDMAAPMPAAHAGITAPETTVARIPSAAGGAMVDAPAASSTDVPKPAPDSLEIGVVEICDFLVPATTGSLKTLAKTTLDLHTRACFDIKGREFLHNLWYLTWICDRPIRLLHTLWFIRCQLSPCTRTIVDRHALTEYVLLGPRSSTSQQLSLPVAALRPSARTRQTPEQMGSLEHSTPECSGVLGSLAGFC
ncbi:hypothetical protein BDV93DRAFT_508867 [Ceratobasidium sp. AG-I]|nr:hypothetical protein BDV93DRAFT_508867 [Ceratobasidium sp. AG-I]